MRVVVTGAGGQLGTDMVAQLRRRGHETVALTRRELDVTNRAAVLEALGALRPDAVAHCAAWTAVDAAEAPENFAAVSAVNAAAAGHVAAACAALGCRLLYPSTDYVFDGGGDAPWDEDCGRFAPCNVYGQTKLAGERAVRAATARHFIVRVSWLFGPHGSNFVKTMLRLSQTHDTLRVVSDQIGTPTYTPDLARLLADMLETGRYGTYHAANTGGYLSWYDFACEIFRQAGRDVTVLPVTTAEYGRARARRPHNSRLSQRKLAENGFAPLPDWRDALRRALEQLREAERWDS